MKALLSGVVQNCHHFHERTQRTMGGTRSSAVYAFQKRRSRCIAIFFLKSQNQHFQSRASFGREGGGHKKSTLCTLSIILTTMESPRPLL